LGLQRFLVCLKNDRWKLRAKFVWRGVLVARMWGRMRGIRGAVLWGDYLEQKGNSALPRA